MRLLITLDGTRTSERVTGFVAGLAVSENVELDLLRVVKPAKVHRTPATQGRIPTAPPDTTPAGHQLNVGPQYVRTIEDRTQAFERARAEAEDYLHAVAAADLNTARCSVHVVAADDVPQAIASAADEFGDDWIVMATHGRRGVSGMLLGSVAREVMRRATVPVMLVGADIGSKTRSRPAPAATAGQAAR